MLTLLWWAVIEIASVFIQHWLAPKADKPQPKGISDFQLPTADGSRAIPVVFGTVSLAGPNVVWYGALGVEPYSISGVAAGFYYSLALDLGLCHGPVDSVDGLFFDGKSAGWTAGASGSDWASYAFGNTMLFGGNKSGGGVQGLATCYLGSANPTISPVLQSLVSADYPGLANVCHVVLAGGYKPQYGGVYLGTSEYLKPVSVRVTRCPPIVTGMTAGHHKWLVDGGYDSNPACMLYDILTNTVWGLGLSSSTLDVASFAAVGETLYTERLGLAMILESPTEATETLREILRHIDGGLSTDPSTGLLTLSLIRADYTIGALPVFDQTNLDAVTYKRASWSETFNVAKIAYTSRADNWLARVVQWQDLANLQVQGVNVVCQLDYRGLTNTASATQVAARVLKLGSYPFAKLTMKMSRAGWALRQADVFVLNWPPLGIVGMVCRVTRPAGGELQNGMLTVEAVEDAFAMANTGYGVPPGTGWVDPVGTPAACAQQVLIEAPYQVAGGPYRQAQALAARSDSTMNGFQVWSDPAGGTAYAETAVIPGFCPYGELTASYPANTAVDDATGFTVTNLIDPSALQTITPAERSYGLNLALVDSEIIAWGTVTVAGSNLVISNVLRGVLDTVPAAHASGAKVFFFTAAGARGLVNPTAAYASDCTVHAKLLPYNLRNTFALASASQLSLTTASRALKPLPPGNVTLNGVMWPATLAHGADIIVAWAYRHRVTQASDGVVVSQAAGNYVTTPEGNYTIEVRVGGTLVRSVTGWSGSSWTWTSAMQATDGGVATAAVTIRVIPVNGALTGTYQERGFTLT